MYCTTVNDHVIHGTARVQTKAALPLRLNRLEAAARRKGWIAIRDDVWHGGTGRCRDVATRSCMPGPAVGWYACSSEGGVHARRDGLRGIGLRPARAADLHTGRLQEEMHA